MTPSELRVHANAYHAIADVLEGLADLDEHRARSFSKPFLIEWDVPNEGGDVSVMVTPDRTAAVCVFHHSYADTGPDEYHTVPLYDVPSIVAFVRRYVVRHRAPVSP